MTTVAVVHRGGNEIAGASKTHALKTRTMCRKVATLTSPPNNVLLVFLPAPHCRAEQTGCIKSELREAAKATAVLEICFPKTQKLEQSSNCASRSSKAETVVEICFPKLSSGRGVR